MRIDVRDPETGHKIGRIEVAPGQRPTRARIGAENPERPDAEPREIFLEWEAAIDDAGRLRRCLVCGCRDLYASRAFPQVTGFVVVLAFAGAAVGISGLANQYPVLYAVLVLVLVLDIASLLFSRKRLVCYRCRSVYSDLEIARHHQQWDRTVAEKHATPPPPETGDAILPARSAEVAVDEFD